MSQGQSEKEVVPSSAKAAAAADVAGAGAPTPLHDDKPLFRKRVRARAPATCLVVRTWYGGTRVRAGRSHCAPGPMARAALRCVRVELQLRRCHAPRQIEQPSRLRSVARDGRGRRRRLVQTRGRPHTALQIREWEPKEVWISEERLGVQLVNMADNKTLVRRL